MLSYFYFILIRFWFRLLPFDLLLTELPELLYPEMKKGTSFEYPESQQSQFAVNSLQKRVLGKKGFLSISLRKCRTLIAIKNLILQEEKNRNANTCSKIFVKLLSIIDSKCLFR